MITMIDDVLAEKMVGDILGIFGTLPHPEHEPKRLHAMMKLYNHVKTRNTVKPDVIIDYTENTNGLVIMNDTESANTANNA